MTRFPRALACAPLLFAAPAWAEDDVVVRGTRPMATLENAPSTTASITAARIAQTVNAVNVEDTLKYLPSLVVRKRHIGDTQAPLATRTSGVGASARSLIYADGALLSALIGNNNSNASPRWGLVSPEEIARIDVLYGPFSAAYPGNSIGAVVNITTRLPERLEASATAGTSVQRFDQYGTSRTLPATQLAATLGDRFGRLALFGSVNRVDSHSQPLTYTTVLGTSGGGYADVNRAGAAIRVLGAGGFEHQRQATYKFKAAYDLTPGIRLIYVGALFVNHTEATTESYVAVPPAALAAGVYRYDERHWSHSLSATGSGARFDWQVIGTLYDFAHDAQAQQGNVTRLDGTGWATLDAKGSWRAGAHTIGFGVHHDRFTLASDRYAIGGALNLAAHGRTRTDAAWAQDAWQLARPLTLTLGARYEAWRADRGSNFSTAPALSVTQPTLSAHRLSPKASLAWRPAEAWKISLSFGQAYRFPTVTELYQAITTGPVLSVPDPTLRPERGRSEELAIQRGGTERYVRLSLFNEVIDDALLSQSAPLLAGSTTLYSYVQNVDRVRTRGAELAFQQRDLLPRFDLSGSVTLVDAVIRADAVLPAAIGKQAPQVPRRKATLVATWRPSDGVSLTLAGRYASKAFGTIDNSDPVSNTYQGFGRYLVADLRASFRVTPRWTIAVGADNLGNDKYYLFHPFPQRSFTADLTWKL